MKIEYYNYYYILYEDGYGGFSPEYYRHNIRTDRIEFLSGGSLTWNTCFMTTRERIVSRGVRTTKKEIDKYIVSEELQA